MSFLSNRPRLSYGWSNHMRTQALLAFLVFPGPVAAAPAGGDPRAWLAEVRLIILEDEEALYRQLRSPEEQAAFQRIFWARRDPQPATSRNEFQDAVAQARARADELFSVPGTPGSRTDCGAVMGLLGEPDE